MYLDWTSHLTSDEAKKEFEQTILASAPVLDRLKFILNDRKKQAESTELSVKQFDNPNWAYKRAFGDGFKAGLDIGLKYINLDQQRKPNNE